jgi:hypothetical protein
METNIAGLYALFQCMEEFSYYMTILPCPTKGLSNKYVVWNLLVV